MDDIAIDAVDLLQVTAKLSGPVAVTSALNLDGILMASATDERPPPNRGAPLPDPPVIPILKLVNEYGSREAVYISSDAQFLGAVRSPGSLSKRKDAADVEWMGRKHHRAAGPGKDKIKQFTLVACERAEWTAMGRRDEVASLLSRVQAIGSYRGHGYGEVVEWSVEASHSDNPGDAIFDDVGRSTRALPAAWFTYIPEPVMLPVRPPYWHPSNLVLCVPPGMNACLNDEMFEALFGC